MKKALASVAIATTFLASPAFAKGEKNDNFEKYKTPAIESVIEENASFPWVAVGIIGVAVTAGLIAGFACCD